MITPRKTKTKTSKHSAPFTSLNNGFWTTGLKRLVGVGFLYYSIYRCAHLSTITQMQTIKYVMSVPIDVMSTSCSRLNTDDSTPENQTVNRLGKTILRPPDRALTGTDAAYHRCNKWRLGLFVDLRQELEQQAVAGHCVQNSRYREQTSK